MLDGQPLGEYPELSPLVRPAHEAHLRGELKPYERRPTLRPESVYEQNLPSWN